MQNSYTYSPPLHNGDPYRQPGSMAPVHPVNLPPLRIDGHIQHHQAYSQPQQPQMPSPPMTGYYTQAPQVMYHGQHISHMQAGPYRTYGIPITHTRSNKKEIKRRTKTGCMTCRKRRIKVSAIYPTMRVLHRYFHSSHRFYCHVISAHLCLSNGDPVQLGMFDILLHEHLSTTRSHY
jgi:hypothetical protein